MTTRTSTDRDRGAVLPLVLVMMVIGALVILPLLSYSITVFKANQIVSQNTARAEAARAGLRMALADPVDTFDRCGLAGLNTPVQLPSPGLNINTTTTCNLLDVAAARDDGAVPYSIVHTFFGEAPTQGDGVVGTTFDGATSDPTEWVALTSSTGDPLVDEVTGAETRSIWAPKLPVRSLTLRSPTPYDMPAGYPFGSYTTCEVYFPGRYTQPLTITGPSYFTSGVYYFEDEVRVVANTSGEATDVLAGQGTLEGCVDDQYAVFYAENAPAGHNVSALGATFIFGETGRLVIDDTDGPVTFRMNQRYVADTDTDNLPSANVSIMTVNGVWDDATSTFDDFQLPGRLAVPLSLVGGEIVDRLAVEDLYRPSTLVPPLPSAPENLAASPRAGGAVFTWDPPTDDSANWITGYRVDVVDSFGDPTGDHCTANDLRTCAMDGLPDGVPHTAQVTAIALTGTSEPSTNVTFTPSGSADVFGLPTEVSSIEIVEASSSPVSQQSRYSTALEITWNEPIDTGNAPIEEYEAVVSTIGPSGFQSWSCTSSGATTCAIDLAAENDVTSLVFDIEVRARNVAGWGPSKTEVGFVLDQYGATYVPPAPPLRGEPDAVVEIASTSSHALDVYVPGYIAAPQGVVKITTTDPANKSVSLSGGVLAAWSTIAADRPDDFTYGLLNPTTQRIVRIHTQVDGTNVAAEAVVQVNETGAWAVNSWIVE